jgi:hypothetical protein
MKKHTNFSCCYGIHDVKCSNRARKKINPEFNKWSIELAGFNKPERPMTSGSYLSSPYVIDLGADMC